jgi:hypothetical protein
MPNKSCKQICIEILKINKYNMNRILYFMIPPIIKIVSYTSIICMILVYDT